jgi:glycosyltransferase involved in cell wall biosynthesis
VKNLRIAFDVSPLSHPRTGINTYIRGSLAGLAAAAAGEHEIVAFAPTSPRGLRAIPAALEGLGVDVRVRLLPFAHYWRQAWSRLGRPAAERFLGGFDVLHFSDWMFPPQRAGVRATTVHDLVPLRFPEWVTPRTLGMHRLKYRNAARTCDLLFCNSAFTARDVAERLGVERSRVRVAHPGVDDRFGADGERAELGRPYLITVATLEPRKNLQNLAEAHRLLGHDRALAIVGAEGWGDQPELGQDGIVRLGFVPDAELPALYRGADAFVFPSRFEGFGIPVIEAMACGVPCVVSSHPSLDEACGDAAVRVDPERPEAIAAGIEQALTDREALRTKGLEHAARFSWLETGRIFLGAYAEKLG